MSNPGTNAKSDLKLLVDAVNARLPNRYQNRLVGKQSNGAPRFELYHSAPSLCSHKVRSVLAEKGLTYVSHDMTIMPAGNYIPTNYRPEYVRLRLQGAPNAKLVDGYTGESSVANQGFDPCVVPTLVDHEAARVVVDSRVICEYIDRETSPSQKLVPENLRAAINAQEALIDEAPHVAALYGAHPDNDFRPAGLRKNIAGVHARKVRVLKRMIELVGPNEPDVISAYEAKIKKETAAGAFVIDDAGMRKTHAAMADHVQALEAQLGKHDGAWVCGNEYTLADIMWTASMWRLQWLGFGDLWTSDPTKQRLREYLERAFHRPSFRSAVVKWPGAHGPSPHVSEHKGPAAAGGFALHMLRSMQWREVIWGDPEIKLPPLEKEPA